MPSKKDYRAKAEECLRVASETTTDNVAASLLRMLAEDYLALADGHGSITQQQQIQPKEPEPEDK